MDIEAITERVAMLHLVDVECGPRRETEHVDLYIELYGTGKLPRKYEEAMEKHYGTTDKREMMKRAWRMKDVVVLCQNGDVEIVNQHTGKKLRKVSKENVMDIEAMAKRVAGEVKTAKVNAGLSHFNAPQANFRYNGKTGFTVNVSALSKGDTLSADEMVRDMKKFFNYLDDLNDEVSMLVGIEYDGEVWVSPVGKREVRVSGLSNKALIYADITYKVGTSGLEYTLMDILKAISEAF